MSRKWHTARVLGVVQEGPRTRRFFLEVEDLSVFPFEIGQFVLLDLPIEGKVKTRAYSIASYHQNTNKIELLISFNPHGLGTTYLFEHIRMGNTLKVSDALGKFTMPKDPFNNFSNELCFIATGTGIAPLRAMIMDLLQKGYNRPIHLIYGNRFRNDIPYHDQFVYLAKSYPQFHYHPCLSRETPEYFDGYKGHVHQVYQKLFKDNKNVNFFVCGWSGMVKEARQNLLHMGIPKEQFHIENFG